jgi:ribosome-associated translation inhibitor RaiA
MSKGPAVRFPDQSFNLLVDLDTKHLEISPGDVQLLEDSLSPLRRMVEHFPISHLHILIEFHKHSNEYQVKTSLILTGQTLVSSEGNSHYQPAFERCVANLVEDVQDYKGRLGNVPERQKHVKGTHQELQPSCDPDPAALDAAVAAGDYTAFRTATFGYEESLRDRVGRWVQRYPAVNAQIGKTLAIADVVEEVFLAAFAGYEKRPTQLRLGDWLEHLIDPAVKNLRRHPDEELEDINRARSARAAETGQETV